MVLDAGWGPVGTYARPFDVLGGRWVSIWVGDLCRPGYLSMMGKNGPWLVVKGRNPLALCR